MKKINVLGCCAAQGALLYPILKNSNLRIIGNIEPRGVFHSSHEEQWNLNFPGIPFAKTPDQFLKKRVDVILGSPSCGHSSVFSYSRKKSLGKPREDKTLNLYLSQIDHFRPKIWAMENLPKLLDLIPLDEWKWKFPDYEFIVHCYSVSAFGNSQVSRKRLLLIGIRKDHQELVQYFTKVYPVNTLKKCWELYQMRRKKLNYREKPDKVLAMYDSRKLPEKKNLTVEEVRKLWRTDFKDMYKWPMPGTKMKTLPGVYRNRARAYPMTVRPSSRQFNHRGKIMGLDEYRVIMGFPEDFQVYFDKKRRTYWLNKGRNTLTKGAVYEIGLWFYQCLIKGLPSFINPKSRAKKDID